MSYATKADMIERYGSREMTQLTDREGTSDIDDTVLDRAIADADAEINAALQVRYTLPMTTVPPLVTRIACQLVRYFLYDNGAPEIVQTHFDQAKKLLMEIARGTLSLGLNAAGTDVVTVADPTITTTKTDDDRTFSNDTLADFG